MIDGFILVITIVVLVVSFIRCILDAESIPNSLMFAFLFSVCAFVGTYLMAVFILFVVQSTTELESIEEKPFEIEQIFFEKDVSTTIMPISNGKTTNMVPITTTSKDIKYITKDGEIETVPESDSSILYDKTAVSNKVQISRKELTGIWKKIFGASPMHHYTFTLKEGAIK